MTNLAYTQQIKASTDIEKIVSAYSEADREQLTKGLLDVVSTSDLVKILDEKSNAGPGSLRDVLQVCTTLGKTDASLAWVVGVSNSAWTMRGCFQSLDSSALAMRHNKILAMVLGRPGVLVKDKLSGRWLLNGEWRYASGWRYSSFFFCLAAVENSNGQDVRVVAIPAEQLDEAESWKSTGLRGTQSVTVRAQGIEVPDDHIEDYSCILSGKNRSQSHFNGNGKQASYSGLFTGVLMNCLVGSMLGAVEAGFEYIITTADKHPVLGSHYEFMSDSGAIRAEIGRLHSALDLYKRAAEYNADIIDQAAREPDIALTTQDRVDIRGRATQIMRGCVDIVQDLLWVNGASGLDKENPLERIWRDVNVGARHGGFSKLVPEEAVGLSVLGRDPKTLTRMF
ncbi:hypothetical protein H0A36_20405 [Endozoicomonas sp. SM1973]|uniref:Acyl-CoA dehydrogenase C-terminal domain-containing protein n=1 Tax=Spartinivicinus marinus TaxID=2994442 RepID=A0A853I9E8_9GAMM|nr:hypothetical protein [Spartinivicinus marinus]MCX4028183.1 hypothetical protein [Spartinivicinus marinus]NYZ68382.1 hypothetical protein [Spartinivicinus marinus]